MISDITLGQFFPGESSVHKLDPRTKLILGAIFIVCVFVADTPIAFLAITLLTLFTVIISHISLKVVFKGIKPIIFILIFTSLINIFLTKGEGTPLVSFYFIHIYKEGIIRAIFMSLRVIILIIGTSILLTYTTSPIALTDGIESLFSPLKLIKIPVHTFAMMMSIALRFIPTLVEETEKIMNAQKSRGADFSTGNLIKRAKALIPLLVPLFLSALKRAEELATAMECRCYRGDKNRTKYVKLTYRGRDFVWMGAFIVFTALVIFSRVLVNMDFAPFESNDFLKIIFYKI